jgi:hypothetical protein
MTNGMPLWVRLFVIIAAIFAVVFLAIFGI